MNNKESIIQSLLRQRELVLCLGKIYEEFYTNIVWSKLFDKFSSKDIESLIPAIERNKWLVIIPTSTLKNKYCVLRNISIDSSLPCCNIVLLKDGDYLLNQLCFVFQKIDEWNPQRFSFNILSLYNIRNILALMFFPYSEGDGTGVSKELMDLRDSCISHNMLLSVALIGGCRRLGYGEGESELASMEKSRDIYKSVKINAVCFENKSLTLPGISALLRNRCSIKEIISLKRKEIKELYDRYSDNSMLLFIEIKMQLMSLNERNMKMLYEKVLEVLIEFNYPSNLIPKSFYDLFDNKSTQPINVSKWEELLKIYPKKINTLLLNNLLKYI